MHISDQALLLRLLLVVVLCGSVGLEREARDQVAGLRTHVLVGLGAALFTLVSAYAFTSARVDPTRIAAQVVSGIGFLGAGTILRQGLSVRGLTTAASLWIAAAIGMAASAGFYWGAVATTAVALGTLIVLRRLRPRLMRRLGSETLNLDIEIASGAPMNQVLDEIAEHGLHVEAMESELAGDVERLRLEVRGPASLDPDELVSDLSRLGDVRRAAVAGLRPVQLR